MMWSAPNATAITSHAGNFRQASAAGKAVPNRRRQNNPFCGARSDRRPISIPAGPGHARPRLALCHRPPRLPTGAGSPVDLIALR